MKDQIPLINNIIQEKHPELEWAATIQKKDSYYNSDYD